MSPLIFHEFDEDACQYSIVIEWKSEKGACRIKFQVGDEFGEFFSSEDAIPVFPKKGSWFILEQGLREKDLETFRRITSSDEAGDGNAEHPMEAEH